MPARPEPADKARRLRSHVRFAQTNARFAN